MNVFRAKDVPDRVMDVIAWELGLREEDVAPHARLTHDLGADDLDLEDLMMATEEEFGVDITDEEAGTCRTVQDLIDLVLRTMEETHG